MSLWTGLVASLSAVFGEPCDRCGHALKVYPLFGVPLGPEMRHIHRVLTLEPEAGDKAPQLDLSELTRHAAAFAADPRPHLDGVMAFVKWCGSCEQGTFLFRLIARGAIVEQSEYSLFGDNHRQLARAVRDLHEARGS